MGHNYMARRKWVHHLEDRAEPSLAQPTGEPVPGHVGIADGMGRPDEPAPRRTGIADGMR